MVCHCIQSLQTVLEYKMTSVWNEICLLAQPNWEESAALQFIKRPKQSSYSKISTVLDNATNLPNLIILGVHLYHLTTECQLLLQVTPKVF